MLSRYRLASSTLRISLLYLRACSVASAMGNKQLSQDVPVYTEAPKPRVAFTEEELRKRLSPEEYRLTQDKGTERAGTGPHLNVKEDGTFTCVVCDNILFKTDEKFDSGSGWPSFSDVVSKSDSVVRVVDDAHGMVRTEVLCGQCGAHLGHVFDDGPKDTGLRYCINGACLKFSVQQQQQQQSENQPQQQEGGEGDEEGAKEGEGEVEGEVEGEGEGETATETKSEL